MNHNPNVDFYSFPSPEQPPRNTSVESDPPSCAPNSADTPTAQVTQPKCQAAPRTLPPPPDRALVKSARRAFSRVGWAFCAMFFVWYACAELLSWLGGRYFPEWIETPYFSLVTGTLPLYIFGIPCLLLALRGMPRDIPQRHPFGAGAFVVSLIIGISLMIVGNFIGNMFMLQLSVFTGYDFSNMLEQTFDLPVWLSSLFTLIAAPLFEELIFRKIMIDRLRPHGEFCAVLISSLLFGLMHGNFYQFFYATLLGAMLGYLYLRSGKWYLCSLMHLLINLIGGVLPSLLMDMADYDTLLSLEGSEEMTVFVAEHLIKILPFIVYQLLLYGLAFAGIILLIVFYRKIHLQPRENELPYGYRAASMFGNSGIIFTFIFCAAIFALGLLATAVPLA